MRRLDVELTDILSLASCAADYGFDREVLMHTLYEFSGEVSDEEIAYFASTFTTPEMIAQGYGEEDRQEISQRLIDWRNKHRAAACTSEEGK